jgi:hypothetical protein
LTLANCKIAAINSTTFAKNPRSCNPNPEYLVLTPFTNTRHAILHKSEVYRLLKVKYQVLANHSLSNGQKPSIYGPFAEGEDVCSFPENILI